MKKYQWLTGAGQWEDSDMMFPFPGKKHCKPYTDEDPWVFIDKEGYVWRQIDTKN